MKRIWVFILMVACTRNTVTDIDGNVYRTVTIGKQVWMAENLRVTRYRNGDRIDTGGLYNWHTVNDVRGLAPEGWHIPTEEEMAALINTLGGDTIAGAALKANSWALGGYRSNDGHLHTVGSNGYWWMHNRSYELFAWTPRIYTGFADVRRHERYKNYSLAVRCIKDRPVHTEQALESFDATANRINKARYLFPEITGQGLTVSIKEEAFDTADIDISGRHERVAGNPSTHASIIATIIGGAGNSAYTGLGIAPACRFSSSSYKNLFAETVNAQVQNHSYGTAIENYYGAEALSYDNSTEVLHVFSAGNSGASASLEGPYANVAGFANITGTFKMAKNNLVVSAIDSFGNDIAYISKGPAYDGRLKPELAAFTFGGSSGPAAIVSGAALLVQQLCRERTGQLPDPALVKALLINTADDAGPKGIDFKTGYGSVNVARALEATAAGRFSNAATTITILPNTALLKATLVWADPPAANLVNDLDLTITGPNGVVWHPWVLNHFPHADSLALPAVRKPDHLNNVEHISIESPVPGNYQMNITGPVSQKFYIAWDYELKDQFSWDYPMATDHLAPNQNALLRWRNTFQGTGVLQWRAGEGPWQTIDAAVDLSKPFIYWHTPANTLTAQLRMLIGAAAFVTGVFTISNLIPFNLTYNCKDAVQLRWAKQTAFTTYRIYQLGKLLTTTNDTTAVLPATGHYYSITPVFPNGKSAIQSIAQSYQHQIPACFVNNETHPYHLYPNPVCANQSVTILCAGTSTDELLLYSLQGQLLRKKC